MHSEMFKGERIPMAPPYDRKAGTPVDLTIAPGAYAYLNFPSEAYIPGTSMARVESGGEKFWLLGWIEYLDDLGNRRRMGLCRKWSNQDERFLPASDSPYEYD